MTLPKLYAIIVPGQTIAEGSIATDVQGVIAFGAQQKFVVLAVERHDTTSRKSLRLYSQAGHLYMDIGESTAAKVDRLLNPDGIVIWSRT
jgi:hypothetical protein